MRPKSEVWRQIPYEGGTLNLCQQCAETPGVLARLTNGGSIVKATQEPMFKLTDKEKADIGAQLAATINQAGGAE